MHIHSILRVVAILLIVTILDMVAVLGLVTTLKHGDHPWHSCQTRDVNHLKDDDHSRVGDHP